MFFHPNLDGRPSQKLADLVTRPPQSSEAIGVRLVWRIPQRLQKKRDPDKEFQGIHPAGGFFWFVFLSAQENEQRRIGIVNSRFSPRVPIKVPYCKNTARRGKMLFTESSSSYSMFRLCASLRLLHGFGNEFDLDPTIHSSALKGLVAGDWI
jgi:hypothetical protein